MTTRPDKAHPETLGFNTQAIHVGNAIDEGSGAIRTPIIMANSYALPYDPSTVDWSGTDIPLYTRNTGANQIALQQKITALEGAEDAVVLATGVAALHGVFFTTLKSGDHAIISDTTYEATWRLFEEHQPFPEECSGCRVFQINPWYLWTSRIPPKPLSGCY